MIQDLKPYVDYQDSGSMPLGGVPAHWQVRSMGSLTSPRSERNRADLPLLSVVREKGVILRSRSGDDDNHNFIPDDLSNYKAVRKGDLVINKMKAWQGSLGIAPQDGIVSPAYYVFDFFHPEERYAHLLLRSKPYVALFGQESDGVRVGQWDLSIHGMKRIPVLVPPNEECAAIVRFLDYMDRRIRRAISAKRKMAALLKEQKQVIIHQAVTRGLNPNVQQKPSGVEWLGDIPEHWDRRAVWQLFEIGRGKVTSNQYVADHPGPYPLFSSQTENEGVMGRIDSFMFDGEYLTWTTDGAQAGTVFQRSGKFSCTNVCGTLRPKVQMNLNFMQMAIASETKRQVRLDINPKLMNNMMARIRVSIPPYLEQVEIAQQVKHINEPSDKSILRSTREIELLLELRTRLISDVVTGKLDVREAAAQLPDEDLIAAPADDADSTLEDEEISEDAESEEVEA